MEIRWKIYAMGTMWLGGRVVFSRKWYGRIGIQHVWNYVEEFGLGMVNDLIGTEARKFWSYLRNANFSVLLKQKVNERAVGRISFSRYLNVFSARLCARHWSYYLHSLQVKCRTSTSFRLCTATDSRPWILNWFERIRKKMLWCKGSGKKKSKGLIKLI